MSIALLEVPLEVEHLIEAAKDSPDEEPFADLSPTVENLHTRIRHSLAYSLFPEQARFITRLVSAAKLNPTSTVMKHMNDIADCCSSGLIYAHDFEARSNARFGIYPHFCRRRICPICSFLRAKKVRAQLLDKVDSLRLRKPWGFSHMVLSVPNCAASDLRSTIKHLVSCCARLRRMKVFRDNVKGGFWALEVTWNAEEETFHPHLHCILVNKFIPQRLLAEHWARITGGFSRVWLRRTYSNEHTDDLVSEACKYVTKVATFKQLGEKPFPLDALICALHSINAHGAWGCLYGAYTAPVEDEDLYNPPSEGHTSKSIIPVCSLSQFVRGHILNEWWAMEFYDRMRLCRERPP